MKSTFTNSNIISSCVSLDVYWNSTEALFIGKTKPSLVVLLSSWYITSTVVSGIIDKTAGRLDSHGASNSSRKTQPLGILLTGITDSIFFLVVTPIGYIMRFLNKDLLNLKYDKSNSYWIKKTGPKSKMKNQF